MESISKELYNILDDICKKCTSKTVAMSGGLDSTILAFLLKERKPDAITIIADDFVATDLTYCQMASNKLDIPLAINRVSTSEIISGVEETIKILKNFNDIEIRNNVVMFLVIKYLRNNGKRSIITGDGADELFAGYSFLKNKSHEEIEKELERIKKIMHFPTKEIGKALGVRIESPYLDKKIIEFSKDVPVNLKVNEYKNKRFGKWILRKTFENLIPNQIVWRKKDPMQDGSGTAGLSDLFDTLVSDEKFQEKRKKIKEKDGVIIRTKESLQYYEIYRRYFESPNSSKEPNCPYCKSSISKNSKFCRLCGAFPI